MEDGKENMEIQSGNKKYTDLTYLDTIAKGNKAFLIKFFDTFINQIAIDIPKMEEYLENKNWEGLSGLAHKIKPSFQFFGIKDLQESIVIIENDARDQINLDKLPELVSNLAYICRIAVKELMQEKNNLESS